jgi:hypothetical protein
MSLGRRIVELGIASAPTLPLRNPGQHHDHRVAGLDSEFAQQVGHAVRAAANRAEAEALLAARRIAPDQRRARGVLLRVAVDDVVAEIETVGHVPTEPLDAARIGVQALPKIGHR